MNRVAILLATYNGAPWVVPQIDSILRQLDVSPTIFISDDQSTDDTLEVIRQHYGADPRISILPGGDRFGSPAGNFARLLREVRFDGHDYVFFSDQDDLWHPRKVSAAIEQCRRHQCDCYASNLTCIFEGKPPRLLRKDFPQTPFDFMFQGASAGCTYGLSTAAACRLQAILKQNLPLPDSHDWLIYAATRSRGYRWYIDRDSYIDYRQHAANAYGANLGLAAHLKRLSLLRGGWYRKNIIAVSRFCELNQEQREIIDKIGRWRFRDRLSLAFQAHLFRRKKTEKAGTLLMILFGLM